jgi:hypothetical protein
LLHSTYEAQGRFGKSFNPDSAFDCPPSDSMGDFGIK